MRIFWLAAALAAAAHAETYTLTLKQTVERASSQNSEVIMARLDELKAGESIRIAKDPFSPHIGGGSGLAYSYGYPLSIEGAAPAIFQAKANQDIFNKPQSFAVAQAKENVKGAALATGEKRDEIAYRVATMFIDLDRAARLEDALAKQVAGLEKIAQSVSARVEGGRELPIARQEATLNLLKAQQRLENVKADRDYAARSLATALGYTPADQIQPAPDERALLTIPATEEAALQTALAASKELQRLESTYTAKGLEIKSDHAKRLPTVDLVAQYALLSSYSNYGQYFLKFQRNNAEIGASIQIPLRVGPAVKAEISQAEADQQRIRAQQQVERNRIALAIHKSYQDLTKANMTNQIAKAELDLAHEQLSVLLAQMNEGRASLRQVEDARLNEDEKWIAFYDAQFNAEKARLALLSQTSQLRESL